MSQYAEIIRELLKQFDNGLITEEEFLNKIMEFALSVRE